MLVEITLEDSDNGGQTPDQSPVARAINRTVGTTTRDGGSTHNRRQPVDIELCAGGGGMAIGLRQAGFRHARLYELDEQAHATLVHNTGTTTPTLTGVPLRRDIRAVADWGDEIRVRTRLLAAGAPCQPFSRAGKHGAHHDHRDLFPEVLRAVRCLRPRAVLLENVVGLLRPSFRCYFDYVLRQLATPSLAPRRGETWFDHDRRLWTHQLQRGFIPDYHVKFQVLNAADYGVPQVRQRLFIVAVESDLSPYNFPVATHTKAALLLAQATGEYWDERGLAHPETSWSFQEDHVLTETPASPWRTVRDALTGLPRPADNEESARMNHWSIPGARAYPGHTGSRLDWPSKTIKAGVHGVPGGENTLVDDSKTLRYFTLRELARIQAFPDEHFFVGCRTCVTRQLGNAVPSTLVQAVAEPLHRLLRKHPGL